MSHSAETCCQARCVASASKERIATCLSLPRTKVPLATKLDGPGESRRSRRGRGGSARVDSPFGAVGDGEPVLWLQPAHDLFPERGQRAAMIAGKIITAAAVRHRPHLNRLPRTIVI